MSRNYKFYNPEGAYFVCFAVVEWIDAFTRNEYKDILLESLTLAGKTKKWKYCLVHNDKLFTFGFQKCR